MLFLIDTTKMNQCKNGEVANDDLRPVKAVSKK
jgi:hypothetical protein